MARRHPHVVNIDEVEAMEGKKGSFEFRRKRLGPDGGSRAQGCSYMEVPAGKTAFPNHWHSSQEEALYVLEGTGRLRIGKDTVDVRAGDWIAFPVGPDTSHALTNTGTTALRYLALSCPATPISMDIVGYPDSKKIGFGSGIDPAKGFRGPSWVFKLIKEDQPPVDYYEDEPLAK